MREVGSSYIVLFAADPSVLMSYRSYKGVDRFLDQVSVKNNAQMDAASVTEFAGSIFA